MSKNNMVLQLERQLEIQLMRHGFENNETQKLLLQYGKVASSYADSLQNDQALVFLKKVFKKLNPQSKSSTYYFSNLYWKLLISIAIKLSITLEINGELQQGLNILIELETMIKQNKNSLEWANQVGLQELYYFIAKFWDKLQNKERKYYAANECILLIKSQMYNNHSERQLKMLIEMLEIQLSTKTTVIHQLQLYEQIYKYQKQYVGDENQKTQQTLTKIQQLQQQIEFEQEMEEFSKIELQKSSSKHDFSKKQTRERIKISVQDTKNSDFKNLITSSCSKNYQRRSSLYQINKNNSQSKISIQINQKFRNSVDNLKKLNDQTNNSKLNSRTQSQGENQLYYFLNCNNLEGRNKTDTTYFQTIHSKNQEKPISSGYINKTNQNISSNQTLQNIDDNNSKINQNIQLLNLMIQRPKKRINQLNQIKYEQISTPIKSSTKNEPFKKLLKQINTQEFSNTKKNLLVIASDMSTKKSNQIQETINQLTSQKSINILGDLIQQNKSEFYEKNMDKIVKIQKYFRLKIDSQKLKNDHVQNNLTLQYNNEGMITEKASEEIKQPMIFRNVIKRSNTSSVESLKFIHKKEAFLQPKKYQMKSKDFSFHSQASSNLMNIRSESEVNEKEKTQESQYQQILEILHSGYEYRVQGVCNFFCSDQSDQILRFIGFKTKLINNQQLLFSFTIEKSIKFYQIYLPISYQSEYWQNQNQLSGLKFCQHQLEEFIDQNLNKVPQASFILIYMGDNFDPILATIVQLFSIIMINICEQKKITGKKLYFTNQIQVKCNKKLLQQYYQKQRQEKRQYYFKPQNFLTKDFSLKINMRVGQTELNIKESIESNTQKIEEKFINGNTIYTIKTNQIIQSIQDSQPVAELILLEESQISYRQILDFSIRDPQLNQVFMKNQNELDNSYQNQEIKSFIPQLLSFPKLKYSQRNQTTLTPTAACQKRQNQILEPESFSRKIMRRPQTSVQLVEESSSSPSQKSIVSSNNNSKDQELQFPSVSQSASLSFYPPLTSFNKRGNANISSSQQGLFNSGQNLLDTQINLIGNDIFDTDALKILDFIPEQENELDQKFLTTFQKCDYFTVSSNWKRTRQVKVQNFDVEYFWNQSKFEKQIFKSIFNNPFQLCEILLIGILKIDKQYFIVNVSQILKQNIELFNQQVLKMKDLVKIQITFELIFPFDNVWKDSANLTFKEFIKWFIPDFDISQYVKKFGLSQLQKISALEYLSRFAHIKDSKLKFEYYEEQKKFVDKKVQRRTLEIQRIEVIENLFLRDKIDLKYIKKLGLENLYEELLKNREKNVIKQQKRDIRYQAFLQLTDPSKLDPITQIPKFIGLDYEGQCEEQTIQLPNYKELRILQQYNTIVYINQKKQIFRLKLIYYIWNNEKLKIWRPFQRKIWQHIQIENKEKLINALQNNLRNYFINEMICKTLSLNGKKLIQKQKLNYQKFCSDLNLLDNYFQLEQFTNKQFYEFLSILNNQLIRSDQNQKFWNSQFNQYKQLSHCKISCLGNCLIEITIFLYKNLGVNNQNRQRYLFIKVNILQKKNMKTKMFKLILTLEDLQNFQKKQYDLNQNNIQQMLFNDIQQLLCKHVYYEKFVNSRYPIIIIKNIKQGKTTKYVNQFPWVVNFDYNKFDVTPYPQRLQFFYQQIKCSKLVCNLIQFIQLPFNFINRYNYNQLHQRLMEKQIKVPSIITIEEFQDIKIFYISIYIPQICRRFITNVNYNQINPLSDMSMEIITENGKITQSKQQEKQWYELIKSFSFSINQEMKLILKIEKIQIESILQEILYYKVRQIEKTKEAILFKMFIEQKYKQGCDNSNVNFPLRINQAKNINMVLQLQWLNQQDKIQSYRLPLYEQMMGYFDKQSCNENIFDYKFRIIDLIKMCEIQIENIIINYSLNLEMTQSNTLQFQIPQQISQRECQRIRLNVNRRTLQIDKSGFKLLYKGVLVMRAQILVGIYQKLQKTKLYFYLQRVSDGQQFIFKVQFDDVDNQYPGFQQNLKVDRIATGCKIFRMFKRRLIQQCQYQLN